MKRAWLIGLVMAAAVAPVAMADTISGIQTIGASYSDGGEFTATATPTHVYGLSISPGTFQTFCIESQIGFSYGNTYNYAITQTDHSGNPLTLGTAWLFSQFSRGSLSGYDYNFSPPVGTGNRDTTAGELQAALWYFQGQIIPSAFSSWDTDATNPFIHAADLMFGATAFNAANGAYGTFVLNLSNLNGTPAQDWLGVPDGGTTVALLGLAMVCVEAFRRRVMA